MNAAILVWVLIITPNPATNFVSQLGPYSDLASCQRVKQSVDRNPYVHPQCIQVKIPVGVPQ